MSVVPPNPVAGVEEELEELGDDVIIAQQSVAHAPPAALQVQDEKRSVVISDKPPGGVAAGAQRSRRGEATVVIRDRRKIEEMRREIRESQRAYESQRAKARRSSRPPTPYLVWGGAALAAFVLGGVVALAVGAITAPTPLAAPSALPLGAAAAPGAEAAKPQPEAPPAPTVSLEDLPVEKRKR